MCITGAYKKYIPHLYEYKCGIYCGKCVFFLHFIVEYYSV